MKIWIDADACPKAVKEIVFRASKRLNILVYVVANRRMALPRSPLITMICVSREFNGADHYIIERVESDDLVITADIPLAAELVEKGASVIDPRGEVYRRESVRERLSVRNFMHDLRGAGLAQGGPQELSSADKRRFAGALDALLTRALRGTVKA